MFESVLFAIREYIQHRKMVMTLSIVRISQSTIRSTLGVAWVYIHDMLYFAAFVLFRILLSGGGKSSGMNGLEFLMTGLVPWLLIGDVLNIASMSIRNNKPIIQSISFPIIILPGVDVIAIFLKRLPTFLFTVIVCAYYGDLMSFHPLLFIYYMIAMFMLMMGTILLCSALIAVCDDFHQLYLAVMKVLFFTLPIMWSFDRLYSSEYEWLAAFVKLNPIVYLINGFRDAFVLGNTATWMYTLYFWCVTIVVFILGCYVQKKLEKYFSDFI